MTCPKCGARLGAVDLDYARNVVNRGIRESLPFKQVELDLLGIFVDMDGPSASRNRVRFIMSSSIRRLRTLFDLSVDVAYRHAPRAEPDDPDVIRFFPFRKYFTVGKRIAGVCPDHAALHGLVFTWDDPFWEYHTPPWAFGCRCTYAWLTAGQVRRKGLEVRDLAFVRKRIHVEGTERLGIAANPNFRHGKPDPAVMKAEIDKALAGMAE